MTADAARHPAPFRFRLLGDFRIRSPLGTCDLHISGKTREVLAFLVLNANRTVRRPTLSNVIWSDADERRSRANLNTALWRINRALKSIGGDDVRLSIAGDQLKLTVAPRVLVDVLALEAAVREAARSAHGSGTPVLSAVVRETLIDILGDDGDRFLDGFANEWVLIERERFFNLQIRGLALLMHDLAAAGRIEEALEYGRRILRMDPMRECVQRQVMWLHVLNGHQGNAIRQYLECARILKEELGVAPMPETRALYDFIVAQARVTDVAAAAAIARPVLPRPHDRGEAAQAPGDYDAELNRLLSLMSLLHSRRQSVFSTLAEIGVA
jgi:DNA-binding SARP family transcriptional activator